MANFNHLPVDITIDIFTPLPAESVLECKVVSKAWRNLIQHPSFSKFSKMYLTRLNRHPDSGKLGFLASNIDGTHLYYFQYLENHETPIDYIRRINLIPPFKINIFVGSINGLICFIGQEERFCICNPITKENTILPEPVENSFQRNIRLIGFGYLPSTDEYKVVVVTKPKKEYNSVEVMVYTLGNVNGWQNIGKFNLQLNNAYYTHGIFANGSFHWKDGNRILVFDLADENFRENLCVPPPSPRGNFCDLTVLGGFLCGSVLMYDSVAQQWYSDIWLYKEKNNHYGITEQDKHQSVGWSKDFTAPSSIPLAFTKSGGVLNYSHGGKNLNIYDPKTSISERLVDFKDNLYHIFSHTNTLVSLKELGEVDTEKMQSFKFKKRKGHAVTSPTSSCSPFS